MAVCNQRPSERVSTHSRPKAAGGHAKRYSQSFQFQLTAARRRLVTINKTNPLFLLFQLTAARRRLEKYQKRGFLIQKVSTHSRPKAAGASPLSPFSPLSVSTHSRPKAAGAGKLAHIQATVVSTHSRPKAAGALNMPTNPDATRFNSQPPEGGWGAYRAAYNAERMFQLTAARRRLVVCDLRITGLFTVSTHSRPKAAGGTCRGGLAGAISFNSQPPEGGWLPVARQPRSRWKFQLTAARRRLARSSGSGCG